MSRTTLATTLLLAAPAAVAGVPQLNAMCPGNLEVRANEGGPIYVNGREAILKTFNANYYEARDQETGTIISLTRNPDGTLSVSYTGKGRANGTCAVAKAK